MKDYLGMLAAKLKAVVKPQIWNFIPTIVEQVKAAIKAKDVTAILAIADRLESTAAEEREHADSLDALSSHLKQMVADGNVDMMEVALAMKLIQESIDEAEDIVKGSDEDDPPAT